MLFYPPVPYPRETSENLTTHRSVLGGSQVGRLQQHSWASSLKSQIHWCHWSIHLDHLQPPGHPCMVSDVLSVPVCSLYIVPNTLGTIVPKQLQSLQNELSTSLSGIAAIALISMCVREAFFLTLHGINPKENRCDGAESWHGHSPSIWYRGPS